MMILAVAGLILAVTGTARANTIASSTMYFNGSLADNGDGTYTGTIAATAGTYYIPGGPGTTWVVDHWENPDGTPAIGGFDVYGKEGATAYYDDVVQGTIGADHDGYPGPGGGGWGSFYTPDVQDWVHYELTLTPAKWYLRYNGGVLGNGNATPMSGAMNWTNMYASEDDVGAYISPPADPDANDGDAALNGGGPQAWDMDWSWGSEVIPLEYGGFFVEVTDVGGGDYQVTLTPGVPEPAGLGLIGIALLAVRKKRN